MGDSRAEQLAGQIRNFIAKVVRDPSTVTKNPAEFNGAIAAVKLLAKLLPGVTQMAAAEFERFVRDLVANPKLREAVANQLQPQSFGGVFSDPMMQLPPPLPPTGNSSIQDMEKYQREMQKYANMMNLMSNVLRNMQDMNKSIINNVRG